MDELSTANAPDRLSRLAAPEGRSQIKVNGLYSRFIRSLRFILPIFALILTVIVVTWDEAGRRVEPAKKQDILPESATIQNELLKPVFNSVDEKNQPYTVTADRAIQGRDNPDIVQLEKPVADIKLENGEAINGDAKSGLYEQKTQKLNLEGDVHLRHSNGYTLSTEELRVDMVTRKAYSGRDVFVDGEGGSIDAKGLEGDVGGEVLIFNGPATVILKSNGNLFSPKETTP